MVIVPFRTDRRLQHIPWMNYLLIAANVVIFLLSRAPGGFASGEIRSSAWPYFILPSAPHAFQFVTYQFLHADLMHLLVNMLFLYVFGNSVEDRLGKVGYIAFYLGGGVVAGLGHALVVDTPVIGASGSVAAVTGAYLALFPLSNVTILYWFVLIGFFEVSSMYLILFQIGYNVWMHLYGAGGVAYLAHLSGYAYGFAVGMGLLKVRLLPREPFDLLALLKQRSRRYHFRSMARTGYKPWESSRADTPPKPGQAAQLSADQEQLMRLREQVADALNQHNPEAAMELYGDLLQRDTTQVMSQQHQLDLANHLMQRQRYDLAARAYELFLGTYKHYAQHEQVELILALTYVRYLDHPARARELLNLALPRLHDPQQKGLAERILGELG